MTVDESIEAKKKAEDEILEIIRALEEKSGLCVYNIDCVYSSAFKSYKTRVELVNLRMEI
jgi:hypothetical protein